MILNLFAYVIIPIYTILFVRGTNWFTLNFSVIGSWANRKNAFLLWGIIVGAYFYYTIRHVIKRLPDHKKESALCTAALVLLAFAVTTPYLPEAMPFQAFLHVVFAFTASVLLLLCLYLVVLKLYHRDHRTYKPYLVSLHLITAVSFALLVLAGIVSSALEILFTISSVILIRLLLRQPQHRFQRSKTPA